MLRVDVKPHMLIWALERKGSEEISLRFPRLKDWLEKKTKPTLKQLEKFANATNTPIGYFFLQEPPIERIPIPDFRTIKNIKMENPSPDLLETIYLSQQRQEWYREFSLINKLDPSSIVGSANISDDVVIVAEEIRSHLRFDIKERKQFRTWEEALRIFIGQIESSGIMVMINGVVKNNNHRKLNVDEFRGFTLVDDHAPLIFVNGSDSKSAQMFTLAHELAHIWLGKTGLSDSTVDDLKARGVEDWCNKCAAEILVPENMIRESYDPGSDILKEMNRLAKDFKVSTLVVLRRIFDIGGLDEDNFWRIYNKQVINLEKRSSGGGGDFYRTQSVRVSTKFAKALISNTLEGKTLYSDAFDLLGFSKVSTFEELGRRLEVI